jgi:hypothetical protein
MSAEGRLCKFTKQPWPARRGLLEPVARAVQFAIFNCLVSKILGRLVVGIGLDWNTHFMPD